MDVLFGPGSLIAWSARAFSFARQQSDLAASNSRLSWKFDCDGVMISRPITDLTRQARKLLLHARGFLCDYVEPLITSHGSGRARLDIS